jgi:DNA uptake protein ComE-like DNA-binding protein
MTDVRKLPGAEVSMLHRIMVVIFLLVVVVGVGIPLPGLQPTPMFAASTIELLDIKSAKANEFKALPGLGEAYSEKIIKNRPSKRKDEIGPTQDHSRPHV